MDADQRNLSALPSGDLRGSTPLFKRVAWKLALICWTLRLDRLGNYFEDVRWS